MANVTYGEVTQVIGAVVDIRFKPNELPDLMNAITINSNEQEGTLAGGNLNVVLEEIGRAHV